MRVAHLVDALNPGGTERQCVALARGLVARGVETAVFYFNAGPLLSDLVGAGVTTRVMPSVSLRSPRAPARLRRLVHGLREWKPDVLQTYGFYSNVPGLLAGCLARVPVRVASRRELARYLTPAQRTVDRWTWRLAHRLVVNSEAVRRHVVAAGVDPARIVLIKNGLDIGRWPPVARADGDRGPVVGMVAHFREQKDHATFVLAAHRVAQMIPSVRFHLIGSGPLEGRIRELVQSVGIADRVDFLGSLGGDALRAAVSKLRVSVLSSKDNEGLPNAVLESMARGVPVVATAVGGTPEVVEDGVTGFLIPAGDPLAIAERVVRLLKEPALADRLGEEGRRKVEREFAADKMVSEFDRLYRELCQASQRESAPCAV
jgi:L-malate glycosyltransferase